MKLSAEQLEKSFKGRKVVDRVSLDVHPGEVVGLLGPNGAGKTTTFYMMVGLERPTNGRVLLDDEDVSRLPIHKRARRGIGYLAQEASIFRKLSVEQNIMAILELMEPSTEARRQRLDQLLNEFGLEGVKAQKGVMLSGGERRRTEIARALAATPRFMLLDEPFSGIDPIAVAEIQELIGALKERGLGLLITDHNVRETLAITDRAYIMHQGRILVSGRAGEIAQDPVARQYYLGERFRL